MDKGAPHTQQELQITLADRELAYISRAILSQRLDCPWDETSLASRLDARLKRLLAQSQKDAPAGEPPADADPALEW